MCAGKTFRVTCNSSCKKWSKGGTISCQNIRKCREIEKDTKHPGQKNKFAEKTVPQQKRRCASRRRKNKMQVAEMAAELRVCRREKKEEAVILRRQVIAAWRPCGSKLSPWERIGLRPVYKGSKEKWERHKGRCQEEKQRRRKRARQGQLANGVVGVKWMR